MSNKITLTIEPSVLENAKAYAREQKKSLSELVGGYLKELTPGKKEEKEKKKIKQPLSPLVESMKGSIPMPANLDYKQALIESLSEKYL